MSGHGAPDGLRRRARACGSRSSPRRGTRRSWTASSPEPLRGLADAGIDDPPSCGCPGTVELSVACARLAPHVRRARRPRRRRARWHAALRLRLPGRRRRASPRSRCRTGVPVGFGVLTCDTTPAGPRPGRTARVSSRTRATRRPTAAVATAVTLRDLGAAGARGVNAFRELLAWIQHESVTVAGYPLPWIEIVGNLFGFASAILGMRRKVWAWPIGIVGNLLLFVIFVSATFDADARTPLFGQAGPPGLLHHHEPLRLVALAGAQAAPASPPAPPTTPRPSRRAGPPPRERIGYVLAWVGLRARRAVGPRRRSAPPGPPRAGTSGATRGSSSARCWRPTRWPAAGTTSGSCGSPSTSSACPCSGTAATTRRRCSTPSTAGLVLYGFFVWLRASRTEAARRARGPRARPRRLSPLRRVGRARAAHRPPPYACAS